MTAGPKQFRLLSRDGSFNVTRIGVDRRLWATDLYHRLLSLGWTRFLSLVVGGYLVTNFAFALAYDLGGPGALEGAESGDFWHRLPDCFFFSVQTLATIGYGKIAPAGWAAHLLVTIEALTGLLGIALVTGLLFARFSRPTSRVMFSRKAVLAEHDGVPSLLFRMANKRLNQILEAQISVTLSINETTKEGDRYRTFYDLKLERSRSPIFALTWTVVHAIDADSPLRGKSREDLETNQAEIICSLTGIDEIYSQTIHARFSYVPGEIVWGGRFEDVISRSGDGAMLVDLRKFHDVV